MIVPAKDTRHDGPYDETWQGRHVCAECDGLLIAATCGQPGLLYLGCSNRGHSGFKRVKSYYELYQAGETLPLEIIEGLKKSAKKRKARL